MRRVGDTRGVARLLGSNCQPLHPRSLEVHHRIQQWILLALVVLLDVEALQGETLAPESAQLAS